MLGHLPEEDELAQLEGLQIDGMCVADDDDQDYMSDTGAAISQATHELDEF